MPRPVKKRCIGRLPGVRVFKPRGMPMVELTEVHVSVEGVEALRLIDIQGLRQEEAAQRMGVSRQTFGRVLAAARRATAEAVVEGMALRIDGGDYTVADASSMARRDRRQREEINMSKIAVSSEGPTLDHRVDPRFGRAGGFVVVDLETMETEYLDNGAAQAMGQGAGVQAAETIANSGAGVLLSGYVGPKAYTALKAAGIEIGQDLDGITVGEAVEKYKAGQVDLSSAPKGGQGGMGKGRRGR